MKTSVKESGIWRLLQRERIALALLAIGTVAFMPGAQSFRLYQGCHLRGGRSTRIFEVPGTCYVQASQAGSASYNAAPEVLQVITVNPALPPGPPTISSVVVGDQSLTINWTAPTDNGGSPIYGYSVTENDMSSSVTTLDACPTADYSSATSCTDTGLTVGDSYSFTVAASNVAGTGSFSSASNAVTAAILNRGGGSSGGGGSTTGPTNAPPPSGLPASDYGTPNSATVSTTTATTVTHSSGGASATVTVPAGALPAGTTVSVYPITNSSTLTTTVPAGSPYVLALAVTWETGGNTSPTASAHHHGNHQSEHQGR